MVGISSAPRKGSPPYLQQTLESLLAEWVAGSYSIYLTWHF